ncbi:hypothetical protein RUND412_011067 [Rhizina undulata]
MNNSVDSQPGLQIVEGPNTANKHSNVSGDFDNQSQSQIPLPIAGSRTDAREPLPQLPYTLRTRKWSIAIIWFIILSDSLFLPLIVFFVLKDVKHMSDVNILGISNAAFGFVSIIQWFYRLFQLLRPSPKYRPLGTGRWSVDWYQIQFTLSFSVITVLVVLSVGTPLLRVLALAPTLVLLMSGPAFLLSCVSYKRGWKTHFRISSSPKGSLATPAVFHLIEDVVAVDGGGGRDFREAWHKRYHASTAFRDMLFRVTLFWGAGATVMGGAMLGVAFGVPSKYLAFGLAWGLPFAWAGVWAVITIKWVQKMLREEEENWDVNGV